MSTPPDAAVQSKLSRFPAEVREAYARFRSCGDMAACDVVIHAALSDFMPKREGLTISDDKRLIEDLGFDSLAVAELVFFFEDCFGIRVETKELMTLQTVGQIREFVGKKAGVAAGANAQR